VANADSGETQFETPIRVDPDDHTSISLVTLGGPAWSPDGSQLAFTCWDGAGDEVCIVNSSGGDRRQLTRIEPGQGSEATTTANVGPPSWSPDGGMLAVASYPERSDGPRGIFLVDPRLGSSARITALVPNSEIAWLPNGTALVFSATDKGRSDVYRLPIESGSAHVLTAQLPDGGREPAVSRDGSRIAAVSGRSLVVLSMAEPVTISDRSELGARFPAWSPAADSIVYSLFPDPIASLT
jgi:TolB protein